jgi:alkyl sulfatase BDS1-like metallo-beta-lactamase superfamily hydrolase
MGTEDGSLLELADRLWEGTVSTEEQHPFAISGQAVEVADETYFVASFGNSVAFRTEDGLLVVDTGSPFTADQIQEAIRDWSDSRVTTIVYTHGHIDHVMGAHLYDREARSRHDELPRVIGHRAVPLRFERYRLTAGYNATINARQFGLSSLQWPTEYRQPDELYDHTLSLKIGGEAFELQHARGETDDHTWVWAPQRKVLACGDFFIWASPNAGNPQKAQRYPREWAVALRTMAELGAEILLPGHGLPVMGADRIRTCLLDAAALLESLVDQTLDLMNEGVPLERVLERVKAPAELLAKPYLRPIYDEPEFVIRNIWRLYGGWYDGDPSSLKPAPSDSLATELAALAGGSARLADRASALAQEKDFRLACHLIDLALRASPEDASIESARSSIYEQRAAAESSTMAKGIFTAAAAR